MNRPRPTVAVAATAVLAACVTLTAQTKITAPPNKYSPEDDVKLGLQAAEQVRQQMPVMHDDAINGYLEDVGDRLVRAIPPEFQHPEFHYTFTALNLKEINAFALPGGPMFVNRGMMDKARSEGEIAGVMAHELSHVALRHGTAQQSKATPYQVGSIAGAIVGAIVGGGLGQVISQGTQFGLGAAFLRFSRVVENEAVLLGTHILARAGYAPRALA
jgi:predicted Zn-dependent protease